MEKQPNAVWLDSIELKEIKVKLVDKFYNDLTDFIDCNELTIIQRIILWLMSFI